jgi:hypothetical protein
LLVTVNIVDRTVDSVCVLAIVRMLVDVVKTVVLVLGSTTVDTIVDVNTFVIVDVRVTVTYSTTELVNLLSRSLFLSITLSLITTAFVNRFL